MWTALTLDSFLQPAGFLYCFHGCTRPISWRVSWCRPNTQADQQLGDKLGAIRKPAEPFHGLSCGIWSSSGAGGNWPWCTSVMQERSHARNPDDHVRPRYCVLIIYVVALFDISLHHPRLQGASLWQTLTRSAFLSVIKIVFVLSCSVDQFAAAHSLQRAGDRLDCVALLLSGPVMTGPALRPSCGSAANRKFPLLCLSERKMSVCHPRWSLPLFPTHTETVWHAVLHRPDQRLTSLFPQKRDLTV